MFNYSNFGRTPEIMGRHLVLFFLFLCACNTVEKPQKTEGRDIKLESCSWTLRELNGAAVKIPEGGKALYLDFRKGNNMLTGSGGCNTMNGMYTVHDNLIKLHSLQRTERTCVEDAMNVQESAFFKMLEETERYEIHSKRSNGKKTEWLELYRDKTQIALFSADTVLH